MTSKQADWDFGASTTANAASVEASCWFNKLGQRRRDAVFSLLDKSSFGELARTSKALRAMTTEFLARAGRAIQPVSLQTAREAATAADADISPEAAAHMQIRVAAARGDTSRLAQLLADVDGSAPQNQTMFAELMTIALSSRRTNDPEGVVSLLHFLVPQSQGCVSLQLNLLCERKANVHYARGSPLLQAVSRGAAQFVGILLDYGADVNARGGLPLFHAAMLNRASCVALLCERKADIDAAPQATGPNAGMTARDVATRYRATEAASELDYARERASVAQPPDAPPAPVPAAILVAELASAASSEPMDSEAPQNDR